MQAVEDKDYIRAVGRAIEVLQNFSFESNEKTLAGISLETGLPKTTVLRVLNTLELYNIVSIDKKTPENIIWDMDWSKWA